MKPLLPLLLLVPLAGPIQAATTAHHPLRPVSECLRVERINEWYVIDPRTAIVRAGNDRYRVTLQADCPRLGIGNPGLLFTANRSHQSLGNSRVCGEVGETVQALHQPPCAIQAVTKIDKPQFEALQQQAKHRGDAPSQP